MNEININPQLDLVFERTTHLSPEEIWKGWTQPEILMKWFCPKPWTVTLCRMDLHAGGEFFTRMEGPEGQKSDNDGCFLEVVENKKLVWTNMMRQNYRPCIIDHDLDFPLVVSILISKTEKGCHYKAVVQHANEDGKKRHEQMGFQEGWGMAFNQLEKLMSK
jgi:uncharacterized protein YndB with AHSA1/START domain